ncbi:ubiquitin-conjugating enzyme E2 J2-like [Rhopilema esculentum]|uniref:ubiquitin-conjugating enzyme E2 J2-like n=1 Tax=Rhopilema esculentum TaxID=499914 RepID=UPI0031E1A347|eukprot:gene6888-12496_t
MNKGVSATASLRLRQDYMRIRKDPVPYITAEPLPSNILEWHYVIKGPEKSLYEGGYYHGKLVFPKDFPFKPPKIIMITPNGRFKTNTRLCLSISDFHPDTWNPAWSVSTILTGLLSFMLERAPTLGSIETSDFQKRQFAIRSLEFNIQNKTFRDLFPEIYKEICEKVEAINEEKRNKDSQSLEKNEEPLKSNQTEQNYLGSTIANLCVVLGVLAFGFTVSYVLKAAGAQHR